MIATKYLFSFLILFFVLQICFPVFAQVNDSVTDTRDRKTYRTITIGEQVWMAENMNFLTAVGSWCYDNKIENCQQFGRMYNWNAAKIACPAGWKLPSKEDFEILFRHVGVDGNNPYDILAEEGASGFNALHGGWRGTHGSYNHYGIIGYWWTSSEQTSENAWFVGMSRFGPEAYLTYGQRKWGLSVRCIKNQ